MPSLRDIYKGMRKPTPPPTKVERDERARLRDKRDGKEMREHEKRRGRRAPEEE